MAEEHRCQAPKLCANNCGLLGNPATQNLCSKCHRDFQLKQHQSSSAKHAINRTPIPSTSSSSPFEAKNEQTAETKVEMMATEAVVEVRPNRCLSCNKRVGFTGFKCRCGMVFCGIHRYPEEHGCSFDFKAMGKQQIAKANPVVKAAKLHKI
ncbi:Zinc finger A20 and AN1 domain-containing stress-associated protein 3 [Hibiscus syriacus]|uniref:Zinc finger A20 and AN1 domain-containing stress-associated protein 3 n=1 Tax=Hibiscus syriacus TaxID=106335 RepID=A0A6A3CYN8_HIBSY|nr:zinc finger A20 and AN1 domain-containing stress-associated protein 3-like [Hibiscus syriacus]KAE8732351.1 Zinc finger A20 and AN1 domain-containing stress-associated protein 3 [Hibiscus syriacus]